MKPKLKHCVGTRPDAVFAPCRNKPVVESDGGPHWSMWPAKEQGLCRKHAQERIAYAIRKADLLTKRLMKVTS